jgi:hypothetical protein
MTKQKVAVIATEDNFIGWSQDPQLTKPKTRKVDYSVTASFEHTLLVLFALSRAVKGPNRELRSDSHKVEEVE